MSQAADSYFFPDESDEGRWIAETAGSEQYLAELSARQKEFNMSLIVKDSGGGGDYAAAPAGAHVARCYRVVDMGTQTVTFKGESKQSHQILISWELPTKLMDDGQPFSVQQRFTASLSEKAKLRAYLEAWRGRKFTENELAGFDLQNIIGKPCMLNIVHVEKDGRTYANIASVMQVPDGMVVPPQVNESLFFTLGEGFDANAFEKLSDGLKEKIKNSPEYERSAIQSESVTTPDGGEDTLNDDIPF